MHSIFRSFLLFLFILATSASFSQGTKVVSGVIAYDSGDLIKAHNTLNEALKVSNEMRDKEWAKGFLYRAKTNYSILIQANNNPDYASIAEDLTFNKVYSDIENCRDYDGSGRHKREINDLLPGLRQMLVVESLTALNKGNMLKATGSALSANNIEKDPLMFGVLAQVDMYFENYHLAEINLKKGIALLEESPPEEPDLASGYMYYRLALASTRKKQVEAEEIEAAKKVMSNGMAFADSEWQRVGSVKSEHDQPWYEAQQQLYKDLVHDLEFFELDLYLKFPEDEATIAHKFEAVIAKYPTNANLLMAYAGTLEQSHPQKAIDLYSKAVEVAPEDPRAQFNLGSTYFNLGADILTQANMEDDMDKYSSLREEGLVWVGKSKPHFEKALELDPQDLASLGALKQVCMQLELMDEYKKYSEMEKALRQ